MNAKALVFGILVPLALTVMGIACGSQFQLETNKAAAQDTSKSRIACSFDHVKHNSEFFCTGIDGQHCFICQYEGIEKYNCRHFDPNQCF